MRPLPIAFLLLPAVACRSLPPTIPGAQHDPLVQEEVLATIDRLFTAMAERNQEAFAALLSDTCTTQSLAVLDGLWHLRQRSANDSVASLARGSERLVETYWQPTVLVRGPIAMAWTPYRFAIDGESSHCGVNLFSLVKVNDSWKIVNICYTMEPVDGSGLAPRDTDEVRPRSPQ